MGHIHVVFSLLLASSLTSTAMEIAEEPGNCWTEDIEPGGWSGVISIPVTCTNTHSFIPEPEIFNYIMNQDNTTFQINITNFAGREMKSDDCGDGGEIDLRLPRPGFPSDLKFCQSSERKDTLPLEFSVPTESRGIIGNISINYTAPLDEALRIQGLRITYSFTDNPCLLCNPMTQICVRGACVGDASCVSLSEALYCANKDPCMSSPCNPGVTCRHTGDRQSYTCDPCQPNTCLNLGVCRDKGDQTPECVCPSDVLGENCEIANDGSYCLFGNDPYSGSGIKWKDTKMNETDVQPCPLAKGNATRRCLATGPSDRPMAAWANPDLSQCISPTFKSIQSATSALQQVPSNIESSAIINLTQDISENVRKSRSSRLYAGDLAVATDAVKSVAGLVHKVDGFNTDLTKVAQSFGSAVGSIIDPRTADVWRFTKKGYLEVKVTSIVDSVEQISANLALKTEANRYRLKRAMTNNRDTQEHDDEQIAVSEDNIHFSIRFMDKEKNITDVSLYDDRFRMPKNVFERAKINTVDNYIHLFWAKYPTLSKLLNDTNTLMQEDEAEVAPHLISDVMSGRILNVPGHVFNHLDQAVRLQFHTNESVDQTVLRPKCVFMNMTARNSTNRWLHTGCLLSNEESNSTSTVCYCNHLTNFAVLMDVYDVEEHIDEFNSKILTYLSYGGGVLSIVGCLISIITFEFFRLKNQRVRIHEMLAITIILVQLFFLVGIDQTENRGVCKAMAICLHYILVAMFCWMLVEGANLYLVLVKVFNSSSHMKKFMLIGWGIPIVIVSISVGIFHEQYGVGSVCWITREVLLVAFVPAVGLVIVINASILIIVMRIMLKSMSRGSKTTVEERSSLQTGLWASAVLLPLLGLTWTFGFLSITSSETLIFTYLFTLFNSFQGVFFFVFHCLFSVDVRNAYNRRSRRRSQLRLSESSTSRRATLKRGSDFDSMMYSQASVKTAMTEAVSLRSNKSRKTNPFYNENIGSNGQLQNWREDTFYDVRAPPAPNGGTVVSRTSRRHSEGHPDDHTDGRDIRRTNAYDNAGFSDPVINNSESSEYVLYYGKRSPNVTDTQNYSGFEKNDVHAKVMK